MTTNTQLTWWQTLKTAYLHKNALVMLMLGFSAGLPYLLVFSSLSLWLREAGIDRATVTMFAWAGLGYSFKFLWAPLIDSLSLPVLHNFLGKRRSWLLLMQTFIIGAILLMAYTQPVASDRLSLDMMALFAVLLAFSSATQDIVIDAYRIEIAPKSTQTALSALYVFGYRLGLIISGAGALYLATFFGSSEDGYHYVAWQRTYMIMALIMLIGVLTTLTATEPNTIQHHPKKQVINDKVMGIYASFALIPLSLYGVWYLLMQIDKRILELGGVFYVPDAVNRVMSYYGLAMLVLVPVALLFLLMNQPKIQAISPNSLNIDNANAETQESNAQQTNTKEVNQNQANFKLVGMFLLCIIVFVLVYRSTGQIVDGEHGHLVAFLLESLRFLLSAGFAVLMGCVLIWLKIVPKEIAVKNWIAPISDFFYTYGKKAGLILALIGLYRISDMVAGNISNIFYQDLGYTKVQIADASKLVGLTMSIFGAFLGGFLAQKMNIIKAMMIGAILASLTNLLFIGLYYNATPNMLYTAVIMDNLAAGLASAVFVAFLSVLTSIKFTAVQYALFSSLMTLSPKILGGYAGAIVDKYDYPIFFAITCVIGLPVLVLIYLVKKHIDLNSDKLTFRE